jgi:hypothetical protein
MASIIWELCDISRYSKDIVKEIVDVLQTDPLKVEKDVQETLTLEGKGTPGMSLATTHFEILSFPFELTTNDRKFFAEFLELNSALASPANGRLPQVRYSVIKSTKYFCIRENGKYRNRWVHRWPLYLSVMMCVRDSLYHYSRKGTTG